MSDKKFSDAFTFLPQGGIIQEFKVGGRNIVLGFSSAQPYRTDNSSYFGETIGRVANRIAGAKINRLNGKSYALTANNGPNTLHGGVAGWGKKDFEGPTPTTRNGEQAVMFRYISHDGEEGFPGTVEVKIWYTPGLVKDEGVEKTSLGIEYEAQLIGDEVEETVVNLTNHSYFNISDGPTIEGTNVKIHTNLHLPVDDTGVPNGKIEPYPGISVQEKFILGPSEPDPDHCFIMDTDTASIPIDTRARQLKKLIELSHPSTGIHFEALSTEPAFQFYTGRFIDVPAIGGMLARGPRSGLCIEASRYVNAINDDEWRKQVVLKRGEVYGSHTTYRAWTA